MKVSGNYLTASEWVNPRWLLDFASAEPYVARLMATIRDVVEALSRRTGVDAVVVVGRDGLPIDSRTANGVDAESVAALLPSAIKHMAQLGDAGGRGDFGTAVLEFGRGLAVVAVLNADALLVVLVQPATNIGGLLFDLRRHRSAIAGLL
jgi:predicted regulator of Ras-like GTPase activity (Roadblock/LC7/MglB family)